MSFEAVTGGRRLRRTETETILAVQVNGPNCQSDIPYEDIREGITLSLRPEPEDGQQPESWMVHLRLDVVEPGVTKIEDFAADPPTKFFEGTVEQSTFREAGEGKEVFGVALPDGLVTFFPDSPASGYAERAILAGYEVEALEAAQAQE